MKYVFLAEPAGPTNPLPFAKQIYFRASCGRGADGQMEHRRPQTSLPCHSSSRWGAGEEGRKIAIDAGAAMDKGR